MIDWLRLGPELLRLNLHKARHARRVRGLGPAVPPAPCQAASDSGRANQTHCEACLRFDRASRYRHVCPALRLRPEGAFCSLDSAAIRPAWGRAALLLGLPPLALVCLGVLAIWATLRFGTGLERLSPLDVAWPPRWSEIADQRRARFHEIALRAIAAGDPATASVALFAAAQIGTGDPAGNQTLARLATLGGYHSLADEIHARTLAAHPARAAELALAWHDDLLLAGRPHQLARLALAELARPAAPREFWLRAFFESIRHPGVSAGLLAADPAPTFPHPGLRHALAARDALDRRDRASAADELLAFEGLLPGQAARRFLVFSWLALGDAPRARAAALSTAHPAPPGEMHVLVHALLRADPAPDTEAARETLRPLLASALAHPLLLAALVRDPDARLAQELAATLDRSPTVPPTTLGGLWIAARRAGAGALAADLAARLETIGRALPAEFLQPDPAPARREVLQSAAALLPLDREVLLALREAR